MLSLLLRHHLLFAVSVMFFVFSSSMMTLVDAAVKPNPAGKAFLEENTKKLGVVTLESGLQYKILKRGTGNYRIKDEEQDVKVNWLGYKINRNPFPILGDEKTNTIDPAGLIPGWKEALMLMVEGDFWELYIPPALSTQLGTDVTGDVLIFEFELVEIVGEKVAIYECQQQQQQQQTDSASSSFSFSWKGCNEREQGYIAKTAEWDFFKVTSESQRLEKLIIEGGHKMKPDAQDWFGRRLHILRQLQENGTAASSSEDDDSSAATSATSNSEGEL